MAFFQRFVGLGFWMIGEADGLEAEVVLEDEVRMGVGEGDDMEEALAMSAPG